VNELRRSALPATLITGLLVANAVFRSLPFGFAFRVWVVALGALAAAALVRGSLAPYRQVRVEPVRIEKRRPIIPERPAGLADVERAVDYAAWNPADLNRRLRPMLRAVAAHRLQARRGVDIDRDAEMARRLLGDVAWDFIRVRDATETAGHRTGTGQPAIRETIERLEEL
jgi:hypothetical protein